MRSGKEECRRERRRLKEEKGRDERQREKGENYDRDVL